MSTTKEDAKDIVELYTQRNPELLAHISLGVITLEEFAAMVIVAYKAYNGIKQ